MSNISRTSSHRHYRLALAGLLHDIGKIGQPAKVNIPESIRRLEQHFCPSDRSGRPTHAHVMFTAAAIQESDNDFGGLRHDDQFIRLVAAHHKPDAESFDQHILQKADWLASGHDRKPDPTEEHVATGLRVSLSTVCWPDPPPDPNAYQCAGPLAFGPATYLPVRDQDREQYSKVCGNLWSGLLSDLKRPFSNQREAVEQVYYMLAHYGINVPSARSRLQSPDISLFDHSRLVAAFASCLAIQHENGTCDANHIHGRYRLIGISLGGIQDYLFDFVPPEDAGPNSSGHKGMAKLLRAKSFLVSLLTWLTIRRLLQSNDLPIVHCIFDAGGKAVLLLPDSELLLIRVQNLLRRLYIEVETISEGKLRLDYATSKVLNDSAFSAECFVREFGSFLQELHASRYRIHSNLKDSKGWVEDQWVRRDLARNDGAVELRLRELGRHLPKAKFLCVDSDEFSGELCSFELLGFRISFRESSPRRGSSYQLLPVADALNDTHPFIIIANHIPLAEQKDLDRLSGENSPESLANDDGDDHDDDSAAIGRPLTFEHLARLATDDSENPSGHVMLGVLKADVDHLGTLLTKGLADTASLSRLASVSRNLDTFFKGFLTDRIRNEFRLIYTVFAGGDDLFLIGPWLDIVRLTAKFQDWFRSATCDNRNLTFSAGIVFSQSNTPVRRLAILADQALDQAKSRGRNRVTLGNVTMSWQAFMAGLGYASTLGELVKRQHSHHEALSPTLLYRLLQYARMGLRCSEREASLSDWKWRSQLNYDLRRNVRWSAGMGESDQPMTNFQNLILSLSTNHNESLASLYVASMLSLYHLRGEQNARQLQTRT